MFLMRHVFSDWRLLLAFPVAIGLRLVMDAALMGELGLDAPRGEVVHDSRARGYGGGTRGDGVFRRSDYVRESPGPGLTDWLLSPLTAAALGGGLIFAVGAVGAYRIWQDAEVEASAEADDHRY